MKRDQKCLKCMVRGIIYYVCLIHLINNAGFSEDLSFVIPPFESEDFVHLRESEVLVYID